jgi:predicted acyltransferase
MLLTFVIGYALMGNYNEKWKMYVALFIFSLFLILAFGTEEFSNVRLPGVLQRIGIVYFFSSLVYLLATIRTQISIACFILLGYWAAMTLIPVPGIGAANLERGTNFSAWIDHLVLGNHVYSATKTWDPEGLFSTLPAIAHGILGLYIGQLLLKENYKLEIVKKISSIGILFTLLGLIWSLVYPLNKSLWSSSYVLYTAGLASLFLGLLYYCIDYKNFKNGLTPLVIWGVNPMIVFFLSGIIPRALWMIEWQNPKKASEIINLQQYLYDTCIQAYFSNPMLASLAGALTYTTILFGLLAFFYKNKLIFKV